METQHHSLENAQNMKEWHEIKEEKKSRQIKYPEIAGFLQILKQNSSHNLITEAKITSEMPPLLLLLKVGFSSRSPH